MSTIKIKRTTGSTTPTGLTFGEPAYVQGLKSLYIGQTGGDPAIRIGAEVSTDSTFASASDNKIPSQLAVKTYIDNSVAGGAVTSVNGATGAITVAAGTAIGVSTVGQTITVTNTGVQSLAGTSNQISVSGSTGAVTLSLPSTVTVPGALNVTTNLTVTGNLTVNGTTTTVNSDTMTIDDPMITLGLSGGLPITVSDGGKDRGVAFTYFDTAGRTGFMGYDASSGYFVFAKECAITNDVISGITYGAIQTNQIRSASNTTLTLLSDYTSQASIQLTGNASAGSEVITLNSGTVKFTDPNATDATSLQFMNGEGTFSNTFTITNPTANRITTFPNWGGTVVLPSNASAANYIIRSTGTATQPNWVDANAAGFTAYAAGRFETARTIGITGDIDGTATSFDGTANINISAQIAAGSIVNNDINAAAAIVDTKLATISTANKVSISALDIDGGTETTTIVGSDLLIVDDGANGTNRKVTVDNLFGSNSTATVDGGSY